MHPTDHPSFPPRGDQPPATHPTPPPPGPPAPGASPTDDQRDRRRGRTALLVAGAATVGALVAAPVAAVVTATTLESPAPAAEPASSTMAQASTTAALDASAVAAAVTPSVVRIDVAGSAGQGSGSGVVLAPDGTIVTNNHVVGGADTIRVTTSDGTTLDADLVGTWAATDLAVLRVPADDLTPIEVAEDPVVLGQPVVAIGSPFGLDGSVTSGIVSATGRTVTTGTQSALTNLVQTDAAINPGNSGGALVDAGGRLVGINTVIATSGGGSDGIGFAIDAATVVDVADDLVDDGRVTQPVLGVSGTDAAVGDGGGAGALVTQVSPGSAADDAGLAVGDLITAVDGDEVTSFAELASRITRRDPGDSVELAVTRDGGERTVTAVLGQRQE